MTFMPPEALAPHAITLGILAGGPATRLGGVDKACLQRAGLPQVGRWAQRFAGEHGQVFLSASPDERRDRAGAWQVVPDLRTGIGPVAGLEALAAACTTPWLFTLPVDLVGLNDCLLRTLVALRGPDGAFAIDDHGIQPLVTLWRRDALRAACAAVLAGSVRGDAAVRALHDCMELAPVRFRGFRFGDVNTPEDMRAAGLVVQAAPADRDAAAT